MKYIGENAIKKLISLIKGDLATKQPTITASGLLKGDGAGTITAADTQEATLVDVPNGLLKGDGTTISAAVAETDYMVPPAGGTTGQVLKKTETGTEWADTQFKPAGKSYLTFSSPNSFTLKVNDATKHWDGTLEYFASNKTWTVWDGTTALSSVDNDGEYVLYLRGTGNTVITGNNSNSNWVLTGSNIKCIGNIENLLDYATVESGAHPTMATYCYRSMFHGCTGLTQAPALPATTLANYCYQSMFANCTSLTQAPALPATTLADNCYLSMFNSCTALTKAPSLPATTLTNWCYYGMFYGCTSLTQAPALPATTLANHCYDNMFHGCTSLTKAPALPATTLADYCYDGMFLGCTALIKAPALPATTLSAGCYDGMFYGCTALTQAPALPATTLVIDCYFGMFSGCTSLKLSTTKTDEYTQEYRIPSSGTGTTATDALTDMFTSTGGTFTGTPEINTTYYLSSDNMVVYDTEVSTLREYVGSVAAPAGYGLGSEYGGYIDDFNTKVKTGWYKASASSLHPPVDPSGNVNLAYGVLRVEQRDDCIYQYYTDQRYSSAIKLQRISTDRGSTWGEWEFINPPMKSGVEYRTTERHLGNPVYKKMDSDGVIWWSTDQSTWKREAERVGAASELKAGKTIYVSTTGRDDTGNGSESSPYATIQKAIDSLPKNLGGNNVTINVASGTYNAVSDSPIISATKFYNGMLDIRGPSRSDKAVLNGNISLYECNATVRVLFLKAVGTDLWNGMQFQNGCIYIYDCQDALINTCDIDGVDKSESGIFISGQSNVGISNGDISNCDKAITTRSPNSSRGLATVSIYQMTGANNNIFIHSEAAVVSDYYDNTVEAATKYSKLGGIIIKPDGTVEGSIEKPKLASVNLKASGWNSSAKTQTVTVSGVLADETKQLITPTPALSSQTAYYDAGILCTGQAANKLTFTAKKIPTASLTVYVTIQEVSA